MTSDFRRGTFVTSLMHCTRTAPQTLLALALPTALALASGTAHAAETKAALPAPVQSPKSITTLRADAVDLRDGKAATRALAMQLRIRGTIRVGDAGSWFEPRKDAAPVTIEVRLHSPKPGVPYTVRDYSVGA